jgi:kinesin family protein 13
LFSYLKEYTFSINDNFLSTCFESAVSIEVWYQYKSKIQSINTIENDNIIQIREISKCWKDVKRHIQFSVAIHELDATGQWGPVDVNVQEQILSGGVYRLKQGQSKRLVTELRVLPRSDPMPLSIHAIRSVEIGSIDTRKIDASCQLDSYQDEDLQDLKCEWLDLIEKRKLYLESQVNLINQQTSQ